MSSVSFDDLSDYEGQAVKQPEIPAWKMLSDKKNDDEKIKWLNSELIFLRDDAQFRLRQVQKNISLYKGIQYETQELRGSIQDRTEDRSKKMKRIVINHLRDLTESHVSRAMKFKPAVSISPTNDEFQDKISAKITKNFLSHIWYENQFQGKMTEKTVRDALVSGESFFFITWNKDKGDDHPSFKKSKESNQELRLLGESGEPETDDSGKEVKITGDVKVGDVDYNIVSSDLVFLEKVRNYEDVNYMFCEEIMHVEDARKRWPKNAVDIQAQRSETVYDYEKAEQEQIKNQIKVTYFYHKRTALLPAGREMIFTKDVLLEDRDLRYRHGKLPVVRFIDDTNINERHGRSFFQNIKSMTSIYNNLTNMIIRNQFLCAHPKWMMPAGACKLEQLGNDITVVQYKGLNRPELVQSSPTAPEVFNFRKELKEEFQQISGVHGVSRGEPPPGVKAGIALQFLNEQENERSNVFMLRFNEFVKDVADMTISTAGQFYKPHDDRTLKIAGKDDTWMLEEFDPTHLHKSYDIRVANSSALPESKAQRIQTIIDLNDSMPGLFPREQILDLIDFAQADKFIDDATVAVKSAEAETEYILEGKGEMEPQEFEDHIIHWRIHTKELQKFGFKRLPKEIQQGLKDHVLATEFLMHEQSKKSPQFSQKLFELDRFPMMYFPEVIEPPVDDIMADAAGSAPTSSKDGGGKLTAGAGQQLPNNPDAGVPNNPAS